jgi:hypothetical protein
MLERSRLAASPIVLSYMERSVPALGGDVGEDLRTVHGGVAVGLLRGVGERIAVRTKPTQAGGLVWKISGTEERSLPASFRQSGQSQPLDIFFTMFWAKR